MHSVHTIAAPPNHGRICLARMGWTRKRRKALRKIVAACSSMARSILARAPMLTRIVWLSLLVELAAWLGAAAWLRAAHGIAWPTLLAGVLLGALAARLALVCLTTFLGWLYRSPRSPAQRLGPLGVARLVASEYAALLAD